MNSWNIKSKKNLKSHNNAYKSIHGKQVDPTFYVS